MANLKLQNNNWEASGVYDIDQQKTQRQINADVSDLKSAINDPVTGLDNKAPVIINTASGAIASFEDGADGMPLKSLSVNIEPVQAAGTPDPEAPLPISGCTGCNIIAGQIPTGLTWTLGKTINASGIAVDNNDGAYSGFIPVQIGSNLLAFNSTVQQSRIVRVHGYTADGQWNSQITFQQYPDDTPIGLKVIPFDVPNGVTQIRISTGNFASFELLDVEKLTPTETGLTWTLGKTINASGIAVDNNDGAYSGFIPVQIGSNLLAFNSTVQQSRIVRVHGYTADGQWNSQITFQQYPDDTPIGLKVIPFDVPNGVTQIRISTGNFASFELLDVKKHIIINFPTEAGTVYGGTLDVLNGELSTRPYYASYNGEPLVGPWISSMDIYAPDSTPTIGAQVVDMGGVITSYQLTPQEVTTLLGTNNMWADCGSVSVEYPVDTGIIVRQISDVENYKSIIGDGVTDDADALQTLVDSQSCIIFNESLIIKLTKSIIIDTDKLHLFDGGNSIFEVTGDFPAFVINGSVTAPMYADPTSLTDGIISSESNFTIQNCKITSSSDLVGIGIKLSGCFESIVKNCCIFKFKTGIVLADRSRNLIIADNNIYACTQYGIHAQSSLDLHQLNIYGNHISYCYYCVFLDNPDAVANWQLTGNDIEIGSNYPTSGASNFRCIKIISDDSKSGLLQEMTFTGNTIQGHASSTSIIEISGGNSRFAQYISIAGNHISNTTGNIILLTKARCISCCGNNFKDGGYLYSITDCQAIVITAETACNVTGVKTESGTNTNIVTENNVAI